MKNTKTINQLTKLILHNIPSPDTLTLVGISGAAALGKTTLAIAIRNNIISGTLKKVGILPTDAYLLVRKERHLRHISGYDPRATNINRLYKNLKSLIKGESVSFYPYDHSTGNTTQRLIVLNPCDIVIVDGIHSFHEKIRNLIDFRIFLEAKRELAINIRSNVDADQRGYSHTIAVSTAHFEHKNYEIYIQPYIEFADVVVRVRKNWMYEIVN